MSLLTARRRTAVWRRFRAAALVSLARTRSFLVCAIRSARSANRRGSIFPSKRPPSLRANRVKHCIYHGTFEGIPRSPAFLGVDTGSFYITLGAPLNLFPEDGQSVFEESGFGLKIITDQLAKRPTP